MHSLQIFTRLETYNMKNIIRWSTTHNKSGRDGSNIFTKMQDIKLKYRSENDYYEQVECEKAAENCDKDASDFHSEPPEKRRIKNFKCDCDETCEKD